MCVGLFLGSLFCFIDLYVCFYVFRQRVTVFYLLYFSSYPRITNLISLFLKNMKSSNPFQNEVQIPANGPKVIYYLDADCISSFLTLRLYLTVIQSSKHFILVYIIPLLVMFSLPLGYCSTTNSLCLSFFLCLSHMFLIMFLVLSHCNYL